jgi:phage shock protein PspC (stress-responsive transcriptional regulator)
VGNVQISGVLDGVATNFDAPTVTVCVSKIIR